MVYRKGLLNKLSKLLIGSGLWLFLLFGYGIATLAAAPPAQNSSDWTEPENLSQSGAATDPRLVLAADGRLHLLWREDNVGSFYYTYQESGRWQAPVAINPPFAVREETGTATSLYSPQLYADQAGLIHAFWLDKEAALFYSSIQTDTLAAENVWSEPISLANSVAGYAAASDDRGHLYLTYVSNSDLEGPAGVYFRRLAAGESIWTPAQPVYQSAYFRALAPPETNIRIAVPEVDLPPPTPVPTSTPTVSGTNPVVGPPAPIFTGTALLIAADNRPVEQIVAARSQNGGNSWAEVVAVDTRQASDSAFSVGPSQIVMAVRGEAIHLSWLAGHDAQCEQYHQWSPDAGETWNRPERVGIAEQACPTTFDLFFAGDDLLFLLAYTDNSVSLQAWDGQSWSPPVVQPELSGFQDPVTFRQVTLGCQQRAVLPDDRLLVVGCGTGPTRDIWVLERSLGDKTLWYVAEEPSIWTAPVQLYESVEENITAPVLLTGVVTRLHAFWVSADPLGRDDGARIFYAQSDGTSWSRPVPLLALSLTHADQLTAMLAANGTLSLSWRDPETNRYFARQVEEQRILFPADWSDAQEIFPHDVVAGFPAFFESREGEAGLVFSIPINETRGVYYLSAPTLTDAEPQQLFDAAVAEWDMVGNPVLVQTGSGQMHALFTRYDMRGEPLSISLHHTMRTSDQSWEAPKEIAAGEIVWSRIVALNDRVLLTLWQQSEGNQKRLWARQSLDGGQTWERASFLMSVVPTSARPVLVVDQLQRIHLIVLAAAGDQLIAQLRSWQGGAWGALDTNILTEEFTGELGTVFAATITGGDRLTVAYATSQSASIEENPFSEFLLVERSLEQLNNVSLTQLAELPTVVATVTPEPQPTAASMAVVVTEFPAVEPTISSAAAPSLPNSVLLSVGPAAVLILLVVVGVIGLRAYRARMG